MNESESEYDSNSEYETDSEYEYETYSELSGITSSELSDDDESIYHLEQTNTEDDLLELEISVYENIDWYINEFAINYSNPNFHDTLINDITQLIIIDNLFVKIGIAVVNCKFINIPVNIFIYTYFKF